MLKGLPGSGKTTWAFKQTQKPNHIHVNKDSLRRMLHGGKYSESNEKDVLFIRDKIINMALNFGKTVIVDDTNLHPKHENRFREIAEEFNVELEIMDFTNTPLMTCIENDLKRLHSVGEKVIKSLYKKYIQPNQKQTPIVPYNDKLDNCIIVDIDGTIALRNGRNPFDWSSVYNDSPNEPIIEIINSFIFTNITSIEDKVFFLTGRDEICHDDTLKWIKSYTKMDVMEETLLMRPLNDNRSDVIIKKEIYDYHIKDKYNVLAVFDDRNSVCKMWRDLGLTCLQVAEGDF
jgi:predicted kinase